MPALLEEILIITSEGKYLPFFTRHYGQSGRDIAAVKTALGTAYFGTLEGQEQPVDNSIGQSWFECGTNNPISEQNLRKFDKKLKLELMAFQTTYQFVIVSYYFEKYSAPEITHRRETREKLQNALDLFEVEFGSIGEGTIAVLHGWRPGSVAYNHSFVTDYETVVDQVPRLMFNMINGVIQSPPTNIVTRILEDRSADQPAYDEAENFFNENYHAVKNIYQRPGSGAKPAYAIYTPSAVAADMKESQLFAAAKSVMDSSMHISPYELLSTDKAELMAPIFEPDHLTDPDPFYVTADKIGFFDRTEYTLQSLPDFSNMSQDLIAKMEDRAFVKILEYYSKPMFWNMALDLEDDDEISFTSEALAKNFKETKASSVNVVPAIFLDSNPTLQAGAAAATAFGALYLFYRDIETINGERPIRFVEFRTPSLRPGDVYRAYFEISKKFLDKINTGETAEELLSNLSGPSATTQGQMSALEEQISSEYCIENSSSEEEAQIKREKYRAFAMKKKLEISREIRSKTMLAAAGGQEGINIDLGAFGNIPFASLLDDTSLQFDDLIGTGFASLSNLAAKELPVAEASNPLVIHMSDLEEGITQLTTMFRSDQAKEDLKQYKLKTNSQKLNLEREANNLAPIPEMIKSLISNNEEFVKKVKLSSGTLEEIINEKRTGFRDTMSGTKIIIKFTEDPSPQIVSINLENKRYFSEKPVIWNRAEYEPLNGPLTIPRTVNYLKNIYNLIPLGVQSWQQAFEQMFGVGSSPCSDTGDNISAGSGLIMRYTINGDGTRTEFEKEKTSYNPFHNWKDDLLEREEMKRISEAYDKVVESEIMWGVDVALPEIGPSCSLDDLYKEIINKKNLAKLLCDFASCINLPNISIKLPNLNLPEIPEIPIFQYPWLDSNVILEQLEAALLQLLCAFIRNLFDILGSPFCQDQLVQDLYGSASDVSPTIQTAFASALTDTGVPKEKGASAASFIENLVNFLTPREVCALLSGEPVNRQVYNMIRNMAGSYDLSLELDSVEKIDIFFQSIGIYVPQQMISRLCNTDNILGARTCQDTTNVLTRIRNAASRESVPREKIDEAVALAEKNLMNKSKALEMLTGDFGIEELLPNTQDNTQLTEGLQRSSKVALDSALSLAKISFMSSMKNYVPSLYLNVSSLVSVDDPEYDAEATMRFLRAANNLQAIKDLDLSGKPFDRPETVRLLNRTLLKLCDDYEKMTYTTVAGEEVEVYRSQIYPPNQEELLADNTEVNMGANDPFLDVKTSLRGSLIYDYPADHHNAVSNTNIEPLYLAAPADNSANGFDENLRVKQRKILLNPLYKNIFEYLLPLSLDVLDTESSSGLAAEGQYTKSVTIASWESWLNQKSANELANPIYGAVLRNDNDENDFQRQETHSTNVGLCSSYLRAINSVVQRYQRDIEQTIEKVFKAVSRDKLLEVIKDFYNIELEAQREDASSNSQKILAGTTDFGASLQLNHPVDELMSTTLEDIASTDINVTTETTINDGFFYGTTQNPQNTITLCEEVPSRYRDAFDPDRAANPMRRTVFRKQIFDIAERLYNHYRIPERNVPGSATLPVFDEIYATLDTGGNLQEKTETNLFVNAYEGVTEQLISYISESRMFTDPAYLERLESKLKSRSYYNTSEGNTCVVNPNNLFSEGPVKFDELVTNWFAEQYSKELADPTNSIYTMDYSKPGPFEKALMSTAVLGFIRVVCLDALLKGAISYSVWDISFLTQDKLFFEYMCKLVENAFEKEKPFVENRIMVDNVFTKVAGTNNRRMAIRKIVNQEIHGYIGDLSKILFENDKDTDYYHWFLSKMKVVNAPWKRREEGGYKDIWISELKESDINRYRKNSFTFLERYIRTNGEFELTVGPREGLGERQAQALYKFIRWTGANGLDYHESFESKLYNPNDSEHLRVPITLDIPTKRETEDMNIEQSGFGTTYSIEDSDAWPSKELYSLEDFEELIKSLYSYGSGVEKYIFHLLKKRYDPDDALFHGAPKTLINKLPIKAIERKRTYYRITDKDRFSSVEVPLNIDGKLMRLFPNPGGDHNEWLDDVHQRDSSPEEFLKYITMRPNSSSPDFAITFNTPPNDDDFESSLPREGNQKISYDTRYYISSTKGEEVLGAGNLEEQQDLMDLDMRQIYKSELGAGNDGQRFSRGITIGKADVDRNNRSQEELYNIFDESSEPRPDEDIDTIKGIDKEYVDTVATGIRGKTIFSNESGKVSQEVYNLTTGFLGESIEKETWEEYVIDLVGDAAPIFNQPGFSNWDPGDYISDEEKRNISKDFMNALVYVNEQMHDEDGGISANQNTRKTSVCNPYRDHNDLNKSNVLFSSGPNVCSPEDEVVRQGLEQENYIDKAWPAKGIHFTWGKDTYSAERQSHPAAGYAFYNNDIGLVYPSNEDGVQSGPLGGNFSGYWKYNSRANQVLGENQYKIPLRLLITQVKDSNGRIKQCYVRYLIPELVTFGENDSNALNSTRAEYLAQETKDALQGYRNFIQNSFNTLFDLGHGANGEEINVDAPRGTKERTARVWWDAGGRDRELSVKAGLTSEVDGTIAKGQTKYPDVGICRYWAVNWMLGRRGGGEEQNGGVAPVLFRSAGNTLPNQSSHGIAFLNIEKLWSRVAAREADDSTGHFKYDRGQSDHAELDLFFSRNIGNLLNKPNINTDDDVGDFFETTFDAHTADDFEDEGKYANRFTGEFAITAGKPDEQTNGHRLTRYLKHRHKVYNRASKHWLYNNSVSDLLGGDGVDHRGLISIGNLVSWFGQRRIDGFFGATSSEVQAGFTRSGTIESGPQITGIKVDPNSMAYRREAADFDCGPSMFYGDRRNLAESVVASYRKYLNDKYPWVKNTDSDDDPNREGKIEYLDNLLGFLRGYFNQNAHKFLFKGDIDILAIEPSAWFFQPPPGGVEAAKKIRDEYKYMTLDVENKKRKTAASIVCDVRLSYLALYQHYVDIESIKDQVNAGRFDNGTFALSNVVLDPELDPDLGILIRGLGNGYVTPNIYLKGVDQSAVTLSQAIDNVVGHMANKNTEVKDPRNSTLDWFVHNKNSVVRYKWIGEDEVTEFTSNFPTFIATDELRDTDFQKNSIAAFEDNIKQQVDLYGRSNPTEIFNKLSFHFDAALQHADDLLVAIRNAMVGLDDGVTDFVKQLDIKHGLRLNLVTEHNLKDNDPFNIETSKFLRKLFNTNSEVGEEERVGRVHYEADLNENIDYEKMMTIPIAAFEREFNTPLQCGFDPVFPGLNFKQIIEGRDPQMIDSLSKEDDYKSFYEFSIPYRRIATGLTIHGTSMLAGYSTMPNVLTSTRASLASIFKIAAQRSNLVGTAAELNPLEDNFDAIYLANQMGTDFPAGGEPPNCFSLDGINGDWFKMIAEMIEQFILYFPSVIFRGIADQLDPAYKEMKSHFYACELSDLNMSGLAISAGGGATEFGLRGDAPMNKEYIPINTAFPYDVVKGVGKMINPFSSDGGAYLGKSINRMVSYVVGAPVQLLDSSYAFQIPCKDDVTGNFRNWEKYASIGRDGRYGHPLSLFTLLALPTKQLPRDLEYRRQMCVIQENNTNDQNSGRQIDECSDTEE